MSRNQGILKVLNVHWFFDHNQYKSKLMGILDT